MSLPRILLIGRTGQVGRALEPLLASLGELTSTQRAATSAPGVIALDLADEGAIRQVVRDVAPQLIVNAAAHTAVDKAESEPELAAAINARAPGILADEAKRSGATIVHYSTDYVFDGLGDRPWREDDPCGPLSVYGRTKREGEIRVLASGAASFIIRTSWVYAAQGHNVVRTMLRLGATRERLKVVADQHGAPTSAAVIAQTTVEMLRQAHGDFTGLAHAKGGLVHLACDGETTWHGFAMEVFRQALELGAPLAVRQVEAIATVDYPTPARRPNNSRLDCSRLAEQFKIIPPSWTEALAETLPAIIREEGLQSREQGNGRQGTH